MNVLRNTVLASVLAAFAAVAACGGGQQEPTTPTAAASASGEPSAAPPAETAMAAPSANPAPQASAAPSASPPAAPPGPPGDGDWDAKWSRDWKMAYMKSDVMPKMGDLFKGFDAKHFSDMKCKTCHGAGADDGSFKMPNAELPKLDVKHMLKAEKAKHPKAVKFMMEQVQVQMAGLLGEKPFDMKTKQGFGCLNCHTAKE